MLTRILLLTTLWLLSSMTAWADDVPAHAPRIGVATMQPGEIFFERFGHNAIIVADPQTGQATSYNFGYFDPEEPDFLRRFIRGDMQYSLVALPVEIDLYQYQQSGRGVDIQWLHLSPEQAQAVADILAKRVKPENARYRYDYFTANCSTQVRDVLDEAMGGALKPQLSARSRGNTLRGEAVRLASPAPWMWLGFDLGLGPDTDRAMSRWEEAFVPMRLADSLREVRNTDGQPLVQSEQAVLPHRIAPEPLEAPRPWWPWLIAGMLLATAILWSGPRHPRATALLGSLLWLFCGLGGALLAYLWGMTEHHAAWANRNLLLLNPLCLLLLPGAVALLRGRQPPVWFGWLLVAIAAGASLAWFLHWLELSVQFNQIWIALLLPVHLAFAYVFGPRNGLSPHRA